MSETNGATGTLRRGLAMIELVASTGSNLSQSEIASSLGLPRPTVGRLSRSLVELGWLVSAPESRRLGLGPKCAMIAPQGADAMSRDVQATMSALNEQFNEEVNTAILQGCSAIYLNSCPSRRTLRVQSVTGSQIPAHCTAIGKALLAQLDDALVVDRMGPDPFEALTPKTLTTWVELKRELDSIRRTGVSESVDEFEVGLTGFAVALPDQDHGHPAAISVAIPNIRCTPGVKQDVIVELTKISNQWTTKEQQGT